MQRRWAQNRAPPATDNQHYRGPAAKAPRGGLATRQSRKIVRSGPLRTDKTPEHQYFADGITEDLTTDLSRIGGDATGDRMFVISRKPGPCQRAGTGVTITSDVSVPARARTRPRRRHIKLPIRVLSIRRGPERTPQSSPSPSSEPSIIKLPIRVLSIRRGLERTPRITR